MNLQQYTVTSIKTFIIPKDGKLDIERKIWGKGRTIRRIEHGDLAPHLNHLIKIARALGVRLVTFLDDKEQIGPVVTAKQDRAQVERFRGVDSENDRNRAFFPLTEQNIQAHEVIYCLVVTLQRRQGQTFIP